MKWLVCASAAALAMVSAGVAWAAPPPPVQAALSMLRLGASELASRWSYEEAIKSSQGSMRLAYHPGNKAGARWQIMTIDGKPPSEAQQARLAGRAAETAKEAGQGLEIGSGWLRESDYRLVKTTDDTLVYQLRPRPAEGADAATAKLLSHLAGEFVIARDGHRPLSLRLDNFEAFSPRFGVKVTAFKFLVQFKRLNGTGPVVVSRTINSVSGEIFWLKDFKNRTEVVLSHFAPAATSAPSAQSGG
ncbi:MAG: hypothetical protein L0I62_03880 [Gammaproteobacteria bacterium]|nr:hypothetical protein [Gammaproteobacteria bacterium]